MIDDSFLDRAFLWIRRFLSRKIH